MALRSRELHATNDDDDDGGGGIDAFIRNAPCAFNYIIYPIFVQCYVMGRFGHENGPFWMLAGAVLVLFFLPLGPFWRWAVLVGSRSRVGLHLTVFNNVHVSGSKQFHQKTVS